MAMNGTGLSRRGFLASSLGAMAAGGLPLWAAREAVAAREEAATRIKRAGPNEKITFGLVGCGGMGRADVGRFINRPDCKLVALCDVDKNHLEEAAKQFEAPARRGGSTELGKYTDFRELCTRKDIDFVIVATPDHWHTLPALCAMKNGKDVYCEKPLTLFVEEGKLLVKTARAMKRVFQVGSQQRSEGDQWRIACELVRNGRLGKLKTIETWIGANPQSPSLPVASVPEGLDHDFWLGPTPKVEYRFLDIPEKKQRFSNCHYEFRWWYQWSGGKVTDWGAHHNDIAQWALGTDNSGPISIEAHGEEPPKEPHCYNCHPTFEITYTYANGVKVICKSKENGVRFEGENGSWIFVNRDRRQFKASDPKLLEEPLGKDAIRLEVSTSHGGNFIDCIRSRKPPITNVEVGHRSVSVCHIGNICLRLGGSKLGWDPAEEKFVGSGSDVANKWLSRPYRAPWKLEA
jgi:predicted dehydrogenase